MTSERRSSTELEHDMEALRALCADNQHRFVDSELKFGWTLISVARTMARVGNPKARETACQHAAQAIARVKQELESHAMFLREDDRQYFLKQALALDSELEKLQEDVHSDSSDS